jgi:hypothetical protein
MNEQIDDQEPGKKRRDRKSRKARGGPSASEGKVAAAAAVEGKPAAKTPWHEHKVAIIAITTLFTVLGGISLALFNSWRVPKETPQELSATLAKPTIETNVKLSDGLVASNSPVRELTEEQLALVGYLVHVQLKLVGFKGRHTFVRWQLHDADTRAKIFSQEYGSEQKAVDVLAEAPIDTAAIKFWVPTSPGNKPFFVRVMIDDDKKTELTYADSDAVSPTPATKPADKPKPSAAATRAK